MQREIKFKIYDKNDTDCIIGPFDWNKLPNFLYPDNFTLLQYTGLNDSKGNEIYEGDIVEYSGSLMYVIEWDDLYMKFKASTITNQDGMYELTTGELKQSNIIGNIFKNSEILNNIF